MPVWVTYFVSSNDFKCQKQAYEIRFSVTKVSFIKLNLLALYNRRLHCYRQFSSWCISGIVIYYYT